MGLDGGRLHRRSLPLDRRQYIRRILARAARVGGGHAGRRSVGAAGADRRRVRRGSAHVCGSGGRAVFAAQPGVDAADDRHRHALHADGEAGRDADFFRAAVAIPPGDGPVAGRHPALASGGARLRRVRAGIGPGRGVAALVRLAAQDVALRRGPRLGGGMGVGGIGCGRQPRGPARRDRAARVGRRDPFGLAAEGAGDALPRGGNGAPMRRASAGC